MYIALLILLVCLNAVGAAWFGLRAVDVTGAERRGLLIYAGAFGLNLIAYLALYAHLITVTL